MQNLLWPFHILRVQSAKIVLWHPPLYLSTLLFANLSATVFASTTQTLKPSVCYYIKVKCPKIELKKCNEVGQ